MPATEPLTSLAPFPCLILALLLVLSLLFSAKISIAQEERDKAPCTTRDSFVRLYVRNVDGVILTPETAD